MGKVALNPISYVTGTLGSGKSYYGMKRVFEYLHAGKVVACNFDLLGQWWVTLSKMGLARKWKWTPVERHAWARECRLKAWRYDVPDDLFAFEVPGDPDEEDRGLLVYDEAALGLNGRTWQDRQKVSAAKHGGNKLAMLEFMVNMRKLGWTMLILAHSASMLDNQIQVLGGAEVRLRNFARVKMPVVGVAMAKKPRFLAIHYWPEVKAITGREFYGLDKRIADHYRSMERFKADHVETGLRLQSPPGSLAVPVQTFEEWDARTLRGRARRERDAQRAAALSAEGWDVPGYDPERGFDPEAA